MSVPAQCRAVVGKSPKVSPRGGSRIKTQMSLCSYNCRSYRALSDSCEDPRHSFTLLECRWMEYGSKGRAEHFGFGTLPFLETFVAWSLP